MSHRPNRIRRYALGMLLLVVAVNAFAGGWYGIAGAKDVPLEWLEGSPFESYLLPGIILFTVVGTSSLTACILVFANHRHASIAALIAGFIMLSWIAVQVSIIGYVSWLQPAVSGAGVLTMLLAWFRKSRSGEA